MKLRRIKQYLTALRRYHRSKGHGIHSPFAFKFVLNVLRERLPYYAYEELDLLRRRAKEQSCSFMHRPRIISLKSAKYLFRIVNHFNPGDILQIGTNYGVSSASMLAVSHKISLYLCEPDVNEFPITHDILSHYGNTVNIYPSFKDGIKAYSDTPTGQSTPFVLINDINPEEYNSILSYLYKVRNGNGVIIIRNIARNSLLQALWDALRDAATTGMTFTNNKTAVIVATSKLPHQNFSLWF